MGKGKSNGQTRVNPQWLLDEVKAELVADRLDFDRRVAKRRAELAAMDVGPVKPMMTFWANEPRFQGAFPVLTGKKNKDT